MENLTEIQKQKFERLVMSKEDLLKIADQFTIKNPKGIIAEVVEATKLFRKLGEEHQIPTKAIDKIESDFLLF